jgi:hypothetical protein
MTDTNITCPLTMLRGGWRSRPTPRIRVWRVVDEVADTLAGQRGTRVAKAADASGKMRQQLVREGELSGNFAGHHAGRSALKSDEKKASAQNTFLPIQSAPRAGWVAGIALLTLH